MAVKYELQLWVLHLLKGIPGHIGCRLRNRLLPYTNGKDVTVWEGVHIDKPSKLFIGDNVSINRQSILNAGGGITIGNDVLIGPRAIIYSQNHRFDDLDKPIAEQGFVYKPVVIQDGVWIGAGSILLPGVNVGQNTIIAAGSVVTESFGRDLLIGGVPARTLRKRADSGDTRD